MQTNELLLNSLIFRSIIDQEHIYTESLFRGHQQVTHATVDSQFTCFSAEFHN